VDAKHVDLTTLSLANEGVNSVGTVPETDTPQDATAMTVAAPAPEGHPLPEDAGQADAAEWTAWDAWEGSQSAAGDGNAPPSEEEAATEATPEPAAAETDPVVANAAPLAGMAVPVEGQPMPRNAPAAAGREEEALLAAVAELGSVPAVTALLQTLVAQRSQARQNHVAAIVANSRGQLRAADVDGLPDATLERIARALTPQSYAGAAQPATVMESEWVEYVMPQVGGN
jgi:hypothetical protein